jgi:hypothetical protein
MLPDNLFVNLIDVDLQEQIATSEDLDGAAMEVLKLLLDEAPPAITAGLIDWKLENVNG